jgi:hypothetical protein
VYVDFVAGNGLAVALYWDSDFGLKVLWRELAGERGGNAMHVPLLMMAKVAGMRERTARSFMITVVDIEA